MAAGLPGVGIGGLFYLVSALAMPVRQVARRLRGDRSGAGWPVVARQAGMAVAILVALWATGEALGAAVRSGGASSWSPSAGGGETAGSAPWRITALAGSLGTLAVVLVLVQLARAARALRGRRAARDAALLALAACLGGAAVADAQPDRARRTPAAAAPAPVDSTRLLRAQADAAYDDGDAAAARRAYEAVLARAPDDSRALFRLAQLSADRPEESLRLHRRYVAVEPRDAWGHLALADALARVGRTTEALRAVDAAERLAPRERDVALVRGRVLARAGRTDAAIAAYEAHLATSPRDAEAWRALAEQRRRAGRVASAIAALERAQAVAPDDRTARHLTAWRRAVAARVEPHAFGARDSDANVRLGGGLAVTLPPAGALRATVGASLQRGVAIADTVTTDGARVDLAWRPRATLQLDLGLGAQRVHAPARLAPGTSTPTTPTTPTAPGGGNGPGNGHGGRPTAPLPAPQAPQAPQAPTTVVAADRVERAVPVGAARLRWRAPAGGPTLDLRAGRALLDATPLLLRNGVVRDEAAAQGEVPLVRGLRARALGRVASFDGFDAAERATRTLLGGALVHPVAGWGEVALGGQRLGFDRATTLGFFAPRRAEVAEVSTYVERESAGGVTLSLDLGAGAQRVTAFGEPTGRWAAASRAWAQLLVPVGAGHALRAELDAYDGGVARDGAATGRWRSVAGSLGVRWAI